MSLGQASGWYNRSPKMRQEKKDLFYTKIRLFNADTYLNFD